MGVNFCSFWKKTCGCLISQVYSPPCAALFTTASYMGNTHVLQRYCYRHTQKRFYFYICELTLWGIKFLRTSAAGSVFVWIVVSSTITSSPFMISLSSFIPFERLREFLLRISFTSLRRKKPVNVFVACLSLDQNLSFKYFAVPKFKSSNYTQPLTSGIESSGLIHSVDCKLGGIHSQKLVKICLQIHIF